MNPRQALDTSQWNEKLTIVSDQASHCGKKKLTTCRPDKEGAKTMTWRDVPENKLLEPIVDAQDFYNALAKAKSLIVAVNPILNSISLEGETHAAIIFLGRESDRSGHGVAS